MSVPAWLTGLVDDASLFPPTSVPLDRALAEHESHRNSDYAALLGGFVAPDVRIPDLIDVLDDRDQDEVLDLNLLVTGGAGAIGPAVRWASRSPLLRLRAIEFALRDEEDLAHNARRVLTGLDAVEEDLSEVEVYVELPRWTGSPTHGWLSALDELGSAEVRAKFRTGGVTADAFPSVDELATCIDAVLDRELPFKATAGLHRAVAHRDAETGFDHHGFLNLLVATRVCLDGGDTAGALREQDASALIDAFDADTWQRTRRWFTGFGCCDVLESHDDLVELGILPTGTA
ncbi:MAG: hypothetical protein JWP74_1568 [Marmoricola sp.]|nr:hypothetical protein [Marmoricola sp.]